MAETLQARPAVDIPSAPSELRARVVEAIREALSRTGRALARPARIAGVGALLAFGAAAVSTLSTPEAGAHLKFDPLREAISRVLSLYPVPTHAPREEWVVAKAADGRGRLSDIVEINGEQFWAAALQEEEGGPTYYYLMRSGGGAQVLGSDAEGGEPDALRLFDAAMEEARRAAGVSPETTVAGGEI